MTSRRGLTLIEVLISMFLFGVLIYSVWIIYSVGFKVFYSAASRGDIRVQAERSVAIFSSDLRKAASITAATASSITVSVDTNNDGLN